MRGKYIIFEGGQGSGKTLQAKRCVEYLNGHMNETIFTFEPGGTEIANSIRKLVQATKFKEEMNPMCEAFLYASSRAQAYEAIIEPALDAGIHVIADRSYISSVAIQGFARGMSPEEVIRINQPVIDIAPADYIIFIDLPIEESIKRVHDKEGDKFENEKLDFLKRMYDGYREISQMEELKDKWIDIDGRGTPDQVFKRIEKKVMPLVLNQLTLFD